jgi:spermidine/putrescine transport system substrate-binding protein
MSLSRSQPPLAGLRGGAGRLASRRGFLRGAGALGAGALLGACGSQGAGSGKPSPATDVSDAERVVSWANRPSYLDYDNVAKGWASLTTFQQQTGIRAAYSEDIDDNAGYYDQIQGQLRAGQDIGKDLIVVRDWLAARLIRAGYVQRLDKSIVPNWVNLRDSLKVVDFDPGRDYSLTWQSGYTGLAWNTRLLRQLTGKSELRHVSELWDRRLKGRVEVLGEMRDTVGLIMLEQGVDVSTAFTSAQFGSALQVLQDQLASGQIRQVRGSGYRQDLVSADAVAAVAWSGDIAQVNAQSGNLWQFRIPDGGGLFWSDDLLIPIGARHRKNAEILINYYYSPPVAAQVAQAVHFMCPVRGAQELVARQNPTLAADPLVFPTEVAPRQVRAFRTLSLAEEAGYQRDFRAVLGT